MQAGDTAVTERHTIRRNDHPDTSHESAETCQVEQFEELALQGHIACGRNGCILDELRTYFAEHAPPNTQFVNRRTGLHQQGRVLDTGHRVKSKESGKKQAVYMARCLLTEQEISDIKRLGPLLNPCLFTSEELNAL